MKKFFLFFILFIVATFFLPSSATAQISPTNNRLIITFYDTVSENIQEDLLKTIKSSKKEKLRLRNARVLTLENAQAAQVLISQLRNFSQVKYVEFDNVAQALDTPNDSSFASQWGMQKIQATAAWNITHGSAENVIAIVDSGIDGAHPDLGSKISSRVNFTTDPDTDADGHGSHVAGIVGAATNNNLGVAGVAYNTKLLSVKVLDSKGSGYYSWIANGIMWAADNGAKIINLSLGGTAQSITLKNAVDYAVGKGAIVVAAAGNGYTSSPFYPAYYPSVISVAATDINDQRAYFSTYGSWVTLAAPGVSILSTYKGNYTTLSGTSMAAPFVSGVLGLIFATHPDWSANQAISKLQSSSDVIGGTGIYWKYGRVNACRAVDCANTAISPTPVTSLTPTATPTISVSLTPTMTPTPTPTQRLTPTPLVTIIPTPSPSSKPWWCSYIPWHTLCQ